MENKRNYSWYYRKTVKGLIGSIYAHQKHVSKSRKHQPPNYTKVELINWITSQNNFNLLYTNWIDSDYDKKFTPSVDRLNNSLGYSFDNIRLITWSENNKRNGYERKHGITNEVNVSVSQFTKEGDFIKNYFSCANASRQTGIQASNIIATCTGKRKSAGGFVWKHS